MRRWSILVFATLLAIIAGVLPLIVIYSLSHDRAVDAEQTHLAEYADWTLMRAEANLGRARAALTRIEAERHDGCSAAHINRMRQLVVDTTSVEEIGYFAGDRLDCTSWGLVMQDVVRSPPDRTFDDGFHMNFNVDPVVSQGGSMLVLSYGNHNALIKPERLVDVLSDTRMVLGIASDDGQVIAVSEPIDPLLQARLSRRAITGTDDRSIYASIRRNGLVAFAVADRSVIQPRLGQQRWILVPVGIIVSLVLVGVIILVSRQRLSPRKELEIAIRRREFLVHYQPIMELPGGRCVGAEALLRWQRPDGEWVSPEMFIPLAEHSGQIDALTDLMIAAVTHDMAALLEADRSLHVAINLSAGDMQSGRFLPVLHRALAGTGVQPSQIWLEATERGFMHAEQARDTLLRARSAGHLVAIDDFGTGYSSLSLLESLPLDALKIDKSFVSAIGQNAATSVVIPHIINMAQGLQLHIVAEGVETGEQAQYLRSAGVEFAQGWLYARAMPPAEFMAYYRQCNAGKAAG